MKFVMLKIKKRLYEFIISGCKMQEIKIEKSIIHYLQKYADLSIRKKGNAQCVEKLMIGILLIAPLVKIDKVVMD